MADFAAAISLPLHAKFYTLNFGTDRCCGAVTQWYLVRQIYLLISWDAARYCSISSKLP